MKLNLISKVLLCTMSVATLLVSLNTNVANAAMKPEISNIPAESAIIERQGDFEEDFGDSSFEDGTEKDQFFIDEIDHAVDEQLLIDAVIHRNIDRVRYFLENDVDVNTRDSYGATPLYYAIINSDYEMVLTLLLEYHAQLHTADLDAAYAQARIHGDNADIIDLLHQVRYTAGVVA